MVRVARVERGASSEASRLPLLPAAVLTVEMGGARVAVPAGFDTATVRAVLDALVLATSGGAR